ncbi:MAG TPA: BMC domain-containing protein [Firmicutes bacterium]|nr:MAG: propanediol utilization protein [Candidatus Coatesbacteria bacterium]RLC44942.1 MAG: propanediol utilization protein [Candidatus Coatesbacteria bacterium]HEC79631.1 BMC domain-containing protein [Bacillota bacterium]
MEKKAIGMVETSSVAKGLEVADFMSKEAEVDVLLCNSTCPGKFIVLVSGEVASVRSSVDKGCAMAGSSLVDHVVIPDPHPQIFSAIAETTGVERIEALGIIETFSSASGLVAADAAGKAANVDLVAVRLAMAIGGKAYVYVNGDVASVRSAVDAGAQEVEKIGLLVAKVVIPDPDDCLDKFIL